jgi:hypothetical protein
MKTLTSLEQIQSLPHSPEVLNALSTELLLPFDTTSATDAFWLETSTTLLVVLPDEDTEQLLDNFSEVLGQFTCTEFITQLSGNWYLALTITSQDGGGQYLLFPCEKHSQLSTLLFT